jgi:hypothetical protein
MLIGVSHGRSEPSRSVLNTICDRSDAHRREASGGLSRRQSVMCTPRRVVTLSAKARCCSVSITYRIAHNQRLKH